jgi:hypothetical protein
MALDYGDDLTFVGSATAESTTVTLPTHLAGDLIFIYAFRDGSTTNPTVPGGYTPLTTTLDGTTCSASLGYKVAASGSETSGTWTNASALVAVVYRLRAGASFSLISTTTANGTLSTVNFPAVTVSTNQRDRLISFVGHRSTDVNITAPTGLVERAQNDGTPTTCVVGAWDTNGARTTNWSSTNANHNGTNSGWCSATIRIQAYYVTDWFYPGTVANNGAYVNQWSNVNNVKVDDTSEASAAIDATAGDDFSEWMKATNFGLTLPGGGVYTSFECRAMVRDSNADPAYLHFGMVGETGTGTYVAPAMPTGAAGGGGEYALGDYNAAPNKANGGGAHAWSDLTPSTFGFMIYVEVTSGGNIIAYCDYMKIRVFYAKGETPSGLFMAFP